VSYLRPWSSLVAFLTQSSNPDSIGLCDESNKKFDFAFGNDKLLAHDATCSAIATKRLLRVVLDVDNEPR